MLTESFHYRPLFGRILACVVVAICLAGLIGLAVVGDWPNVVRTAWPLLLISAVVIALFWRPRIVIEEHGITIVNVFRTFEVPWPAIERIDTRFTLTLFTHGRRIPVWAAPSPGIRGAISIERADVRNLNETAYGPGNSVRPGDSISTPSGQVAFVLRQRWEALRDTGHLVSTGSTSGTGSTTSSVVEEGSLQVTTHWGTICVLAVLLTATALSATL